MTPIKYLTNQMPNDWNDYEIVKSVILWKKISLIFTNIKMLSCKMMQSLIFSASHFLPHHLTNMQKLNFFFDQTDTIRVINKKAPLGTTKN